MNSSASVPFRANRMSKSPSSRKISSSSFRISAKSSAMRSLITKPSMIALDHPIELCQHIGLDLIEKLRRIDQEDHTVLRIQISHAANQAHLLSVKPPVRDG